MILKCEDWHENLDGRIRVCTAYVKVDYRKDLWNVVFPNLTYSQVSRRWKSVGAYNEDNNAQAFANAYPFTVILEDENGELYTSIIATRNQMP